jgi:dienelactone hydrolase
MTKSGVPGFTLRDHVEKEAVKWLAHVIGVQNITRAFWNRWRASMIGEAAIMDFLRSIRKLDDWAVQANRLIGTQEAAYQISSATMSDAQRIEALRRLSFICHMGQWGEVDLNDTRKKLYRRSRDYYVAAESLAHGDRYRRRPFEWHGRTFWGNIHYPAAPASPYPGVVIVHGMDDTKEEHLMTELFAQAAGIAVCSIDGPGQGEALILDGEKWPADYDQFILTVIDRLVREYRFDADAIGLAGVSWGGFWIYKIAAQWPAVRGLFDLGGPIDWINWYYKLPFFLKARFCLVLGTESEAQIDALASPFTLSASMLAQIHCPVRIVHGGNDPVVTLADKETLLQQLKKRGIDASMKVFPNDDHCCTANAAAVRAEAVNFFAGVLLGERGDPGRRHGAHP